MARITVRLIPRAGRDDIHGWDGDVIRARVAAAPADGKANAALIRLLAQALGVPPSRVTLVSGASSRTKILDVEGIDSEQLRARLGSG